jgi:hypothetical protein
MNAPMRQRRLARQTFIGFAILAMLSVLWIAAFLVSPWMERRIAPVMR